MNLRRFPIAVPVAALAALAGTALPGRQAVVTDRLPIPPQSKQAAVLQTLRETFKPRLADSSDKGRLSLAAELREKASGFDKDPTGRYVYIDEARRLSLEATDLSAALQAIVDLESYFLVDTASLQVEAVAKVANEVAQEEASTVAIHVLDLVEELMSSGNLKSAERVLKAGAPVRQKLSEPSVQSRWISANWHIGARHKADRAREKLVGTPDDARSLETLGRYMCLVENDYKQGLAMLKSVPVERSQDRVLRRLAEDDLSDPTNPQGQLELGNRWLDFAKAVEPMERKGPCLRSVYWYELAQLEFTGTATGVLLAARIEEARAMDIAAPVLQDKKLPSGTPSVVTDISAQLLKNPSCDEPITGDGIPGWSTVQGSWSPRDVGPAPQHGAYYFFAGATEQAELAQTVNLAAFVGSLRRGRAKISFQCYLASWNLNDTLGVIVEALDSSGRVIETFGSGDRNCSQQWELYSETWVVPPATRSVKVRLLSRRNEGRNNDGYFDDLSLTVISE